MQSVQRPGCGLVPKLSSLAFTVVNGSLSNRNTPTVDMTEARDRRLQHFSSSIFSPATSRAATPPPAFSRCASRGEVLERRDIPTYQSTVFSPAEPVQTRFNPHKPQDHNTGDFYRLDPQSEAKKRTVTDSHPVMRAEKPKKQTEHSLRSITPQPVPDKGSASPIQKHSKAANSILKDSKNVRHERGTGIDGVACRNSLKWTDLRPEVTRKSQRTKTPEECRLKGSQSTVFELPSAQINDENAKSPVKTPRKIGEVEPVTRTARESTPTSANWKDARFEDKPKQWGDSYSAAEFRDMQLRSSFDPPCTISAPVPRREPIVCQPPPNPREMKRLNLNQVDIPDIPKPEEVQLDAFLIKGLKPNDDVQTVKQLCQGLHIVSAETVVDDIVGNCTGQAKLVIRHLPGSDTVERLKSSVREAGLEISPHRPDIRRKSHYTELACTSFLDNQLQLEEKRFPSDSPLPPKLTKMKLLGSAADLFGSSPGLGKCEQGWSRTKARREEQTEAREQLQRWQTVKKTRSNTPTAVNVVRRDSSFLRPTESWKHKTKQ